MLQGTTALGATAVFSGLSRRAQAALAAPAPAHGQLSDIEHIVILMQENRAFDHYFGTLSGVIGFDDPDVPTDPITGRTAFEQLNPLPVGGLTVRPWPVDPRTSAAQCMADVDHLWQTQHLAVNNGSENLWVASHIPLDTVTGVGTDPRTLLDGGRRPMAYFNRKSLPFHYALADAFTICDRYFSSVRGPTTANRLYLMSASLDPDGVAGGPEVNNLKYPRAGFSWRTYPENLQAAGVDWWIYREPDDYDDNVVDYFVQYQDRRTELFRRGRSTVPAGQLANRIRHDVETGRLPQVSWIVGPKATTEHPDEMPAQGEDFIRQILEALTAKRSVWAKTLLILTYDENGGFFDHVPPPQPEPFTPGEYLTPRGLAMAPESFGIPGPIGLGPRVPTLLISPFTRGGYVCSKTFDHTSILRLLERRFGVEVPNLTEWRRDTCGDLTWAINFAGTPDTRVPTLPDTKARLAEARAQCAKLPPAAPPALGEHVPLPRQEPGRRPRPSGPVPRGRARARSGLHAT
ncbi:MAG TPA: alkaline phosphatase family protein [Acidimicrobiales bacterium]|nr:alkaline phosphatase family protein [Acidimicrobiales bacterium]